MALPTDKDSSDTDKNTRSDNASFFVERRQHDRRKQENDRRKSNSSMQHQQALSEERVDDRRNAKGSLDQPLLSNAAQNLAHIWIITEDTDLFNQLKSDIRVSFSSSNISQHIPNQIENQNNERLHNKTVNIHPDVILIDGRSSTEKLINSLSQIRKKMASTEIILLYDQISSDFINVIIEYHINGLIQTGVNSKLLIKAINAVCTGEIWLPHSLITNAFEVCFKQKGIYYSSSPINSLITVSEERVLKLLILGLSNKQIAQKLTVSPETIKKHLKSLFAKIGVHTRYELLAWYLSKLKK